MNHVSPLDTSRFGYKIGKINNLEDLKFETLLKLKHDDVKLVISRVPSENIQLINQMEDWGFRIKDIQLTYRYDLQKNNVQNQYINDELIIREANQSDLEKLQIIAMECFEDYGHYFANQRLDRKKSIEIYTDWASRSLIEKTKDEKFFVAEQDSNILGFLTFRTHKLNDLTYSSGGIGAVSAKARGKNVFSSISLKGIEWGISQNHVWQEHNVLSINYPVNKVFAKLGFSNYKSETTLHLWLDYLKE